MYFILKVLISAVLIALISEVSKLNSKLGALLASIPLTSVLAIIWMYKEGTEVEKIAKLSIDIIWLVLPSLLLFIILPIFLRNGVNFWFSLGAGIVATALGYVGMMKFL